MPKAKADTTFAQEITEEERRAMEQVQLSSGDLTDVGFAGATAHAHEKGTDPIYRADGAAKAAAIAEQTHRPLDVLKSLSVWHRLQAEAEARDGGQQGVEAARHHWLRSFALLDRCKLKAPSWQMKFVSALAAPLAGLDPLALNGSVTGVEVLNDLLFRGDEGARGQLLNILEDVERAAPRTSIEFIDEVLAEAPGLGKALSALKSDLKQRLGAQADVERVTDVSLESIPDLVQAGQPKAVLKAIDKWWREGPGLHEAPTDQLRTVGEALIQAVHQMHEASAPSVVDTQGAATDAPRTGLAAPATSSAAAEAVANCPRVARELSAGELQPDDKARTAGELFNLARAPKSFFESADLARRGALAAVRDGDTVRQYVACATLFAARMAGHKYLSENRFEEAYQYYLEYARLRRTHHDRELQRTFESLTRPVLKFYFEALAKELGIRAVGEEAADVMAVILDKGGKDGKERLADMIAKLKGANPGFASDLSSQVARRRDDLVHSMADDLLRMLGA